MGNYNFKNENNGNSKLTNDQVRQIKILAACKTKTYRQIAALYNVSHAHVYKIVNGKTRQGV
jgi:Mor family transcriptional regulator